jgi:CYTH domain-containing protein
MTPDHPDAPEGKGTKYARIERERRFLLAAVPVEPAIRRAIIEDRYLRGTRLRLRRSTNVDDPNDVIFKLTQKIPAANAAPGLITTVYLSRAEYDVLAGIAADPIRKVRSSIPPLGVDVFEGPLTGLVLAEAEFEDDAGRHAFEIPGDAVAEVTSDIRFTGRALARLTAADLAKLLGAFRADRSDPRGRARASSSRTG